jgi:hypothetical protein
MDTSSDRSNEDLEKVVAKVETASNQNIELNITPWWRRLASFGVEMRGVEPVALKDRDDKRPFNIFSFWWTASLTMLA